MNLITLSNSRLKGARNCLRYDKLRYRLGYRPLRRFDTLRFGSLMHAGLEVWWKWTPAAEGDRLNASLAAMAGESDPFEKAKAEALMIGYHERWKDEPDIETIAVEVEFAGPLVNPATGAESKTFVRRGKVDALAWDHGRKMLVEHKTSSEDIRQGSDYWLRLRMDSQVSTYFEGARFLGHDVEGCIYDVIKKPGLRPTEIPELDEDGIKIVLDRDGNRVRTKDGKKWRQTGDTELGYAVKSRPETPEEYRNRILEDIARDPTAYYQRSEVARLELDMREFLADDWHFARFMRESIRDDSAPRNPDGCKKYGRLCEFFAVCTGAASLDDPDKFERLEDPFTELSGVATVEQGEGALPEEK